jgi:MFS family permease
MRSSNRVASATDQQERERLLRMLAAVTFLVFFQDMVAPIIPALSQAFGTSVQTVALVVPAYLIPYGIATRVYGLLADHFGIHRVIFGSLTAFMVLATATATATSIEQITAWRVVTGLGASGVVPMALVLVGRLFPYKQRGRRF